jgi:hypothetical protein
MSTLTIASPGVQINEVDLSLIARPIGATDVLITGFAPQGPTEDLVNVGSVSEFESIYGTPTNGAERYLYHTARQILSNSPANLLVSRIPYGAELGNGYTNSYSALVYPISSNKATYEESTEFRFFEPTSILLDDEQYYKVISNDINWSNTPFNYTVGTEETIFGQLAVDADTNLATTASLTSARIYDFTVTDFSNLTLDQKQTILVNSLGGYLSSTQAYLYYDADWLILTGALSGTYTTVYDSYSAQNGGISLISLNGYIASAADLGENPYLAATYGEYISLNSTITSYKLNTGTLPSSVTSAEDLIDNGYGGLVVLNTSKTAVNNLYEGYYIGIADNSSPNFNPSEPYNSIQALMAVNGNNNLIQDFTMVPPKRLNFALTQTASSYIRDSISKVIEQYPIGYDFATPSFSDSLVLMLFKIKSTQYAQDTIKLDYSVSESYAGSLYVNRTQNNQNAGTPVSFFLDTVVNNKSPNIKCITNPYISTQGNWTKSDGNPAKNVTIDITAKKGYSTGVYVQENSLDNKDLGKVDLKIKRFLDVLANDDTTNIDVVADAGLSTIWATAVAQKTENGTSTYTFDETYTPYDIDDIFGIGNNNVNVVPSGVTLDAYQAITQKFVEFADARRDHVFISDPLRQIFVRGQNSKVSSRKSYVFSNNIYWPLNNTYNTIQSSYVTTYGNWIKVNDPWSGKGVWLPSSGYATAIIAKSAQTTYPWIAPAGFNRGTLTNVLDIAVNATQKQRDLLYKINVNPIAYFNQDGFVIYGQKTLYRKPSAFDRINVRRLFLTLEKATQKLLKYFVFEPNSFATRNRLKGALTPLFDQAKINEGCYDYLIVCDTTNNTPDVIDNNELKVSIYIQPVRAAEFILADFIATRTGVNFSELIGGGQS